MSGSRRPIITITISGPQAVGKTLLAGALLDKLLELGATHLDTFDESLDANSQGPARKALRQKLGKATVRIRTTNVEAA